MSFRPDQPRGPRRFFGADGAWIWVSALTVSLALLWGDSGRRLTAIDQATSRSLGSAPAAAPTPESRSGYRWDQHRILLTQPDGYQWLLQTEAAAAAGDLRLREVAYDNAPEGREVHWAAPLRWWLELLAGARRLVSSELTWGAALESVAPWANAALLAMLLVVTTPLVAIRFGSTAGALFALGSVAAAPVYDLFAAGYVDHHGIAAWCCAMTVLSMLAGGAGWVRRSDGALPPDLDRLLWEWLPDVRRARLWLGASGVIGAAGLWISAATTAPVLASLGAACLVSALAASGARETPGSWTFDGRLLRVWGVSGAAASFGMYLLEYFPHDLGMRLEVNHPLYALAWLGAGDLLVRITWMGGPAAADRSRRRIAWIIGDLALILALPAVVVLAGTATFRVADPFLWALHDRYIEEFLALRTWIVSRPPLTVAVEVSLVPLVMLPIGAAMWTRAGAPAARSSRMLSAIVAAISAAYAYVFFYGLARGNDAAGVAAALLVLALLFLWPLRRRPPEPPAAARALTLVAVVPAAALLVTALLQMRWLGLAAYLALAAGVGTAPVLLRATGGWGRSRSYRAGVRALALAVIAPPTLFSGSRPVAPSNIDAITRDASAWLRHRLGDQEGVVLAGPGPTNRMIWFGGFHGVGTLYWENLEGLRASAAIYGAVDADSTLDRLRARGVTHVAFYGWDGGLEQLVAASAPGSGEAGTGRVGVLHTVEQDLRQGRSASLPPWLVPLPYMPPRVAGYTHPIVHLFEVVPDMPPELAQVRLARYYQVLGDTRMDEALARSLATAPSAAGLAMAAQLQSLRAERAQVETTLGQLREQLARGTPIDPEDRLEVAIALGLAGDEGGISGQLDLVLEEADEAQLRRLRPERLALLVDLAVQLGLQGAHPEAMASARGLLPPG